MTSKPIVKEPVKKETYKEMIARQNKCDHSWYNVGQSHTGNITGQRCDKCGKQEWF